MARRGLPQKVQWNMLHVFTNQELPWTDMYKFFGNFGCFCARSWVQTPFVETPNNMGIDSI